MNVWRCAGARPDARACRRRVRTRPTWRVDQERWIGEICDRCWREQLDAHPARVLEIAADPNAPDDVIRSLSRLDDPQMELVIASRGDRLPDDVRAHLASSERSEVRQAASNRERVPLEPARWLYRTKPTPTGQHRFAIGTALVLAVAAVGTIVAIAQRNPSDEPTIGANSGTTFPTGAPDPSSEDLGEIALQTHEFDVDGPEGSVCILFVTVTEVDEYTLVSPNIDTFPSVGFTSVTGPPGTWAIDYFAPPSTAIDPSIEVSGCA